MENVFEYIFMCIYFLVMLVLPLGGALFFLVKLLLRQISTLKASTTDESPGITQRLKIAFTIFGILYGLLPLFAFLAVKAFKLIDIVLPEREVVVAVFVLYVPYFCCVYGIAFGLGAHGLGFSLGSLGASSKHMFKTLFPVKNNNDIDKNDMGT